MLKAEITDKPFGSTLEIGDKGVIDGYIPGDHRGTTMAIFVRNDGYIEAVNIAFVKAARDE